MTRTTHPAGALVAATSGRRFGTASDETNFLEGRSWDELICFRGSAGICWRSSPWVDVHPAE